MASLISQLPDMGSIQTNVGSLVSNIGNLKTLAQGVSTGDLGTVAANISILPIPTPADWLAPILSGLSQLESVSPSDGGAIVTLLLEGVLEKGGLFEGEVAEKLTSLINAIKPLTDLADKAAEIKTLADQVGGTFTQLKDYSWESGDIASVVGQLLTFVNQLTWVVADAPVTKKLKDGLDQINSWLSGDLSTLSASAAAAFNEVARLFSEPFETAMTTYLPQITAITETVNAASLSGLLDQLTPLYSSLSMDIPSTEETFNQAIAAVEQVKTDVSGHISSLSALFDSLEAAIPALNLPDFREDLETALTSVLDIIRPDSGRTFINDIADYAIRVIRKADPAYYKTRFDEHVDKVMEIAETLNTSSIQEPLKEACQAVGEALDEAEQKVVEVTVQIQSALEKAADVLDNIDFDGALTAAQTSVATLQGKATEIFGTIENAISGIVDFIENFTTNAGTMAASVFEDIKDALQTAMDQISVMFDPGNPLGDLLAEVESVVDSIGAALSGISITPVFDEVNDAIDEQKAKLAEVDVSSLNPMLKGLLSAAVQVLKQADFPSTTPDAVKDLLHASENILEPVKRGVNLFGDKVNAFDPIPLAVSPLQDAMDDVMDTISGLSPAPLLAPIESAYNQALSQLDLLDVSVLFQPVDAAFQTLDGLLDSIDPTQLETLIKQGLSEIAEKIDALPVNDLIEKVTGFYDNLLSGLGEDVFSAESSLTVKLKDLYDKMDPQILTNAVNTVIDTVATRAASMDSSVLTPALQAISSAVTGLTNRFKNLPVTDQLKTWAQAMSAINATTALTGLQQTWSSARSQINNATVPADLEDEKAALLAKMDELAPLALLGGTASRFDQCVQQGVSLADDVDALFYEVGHNVDSAASLLSQWQVDTAGGNAAEQLVRQYLTDLLLRPVNGLTALLQSQKAAWGELIDSVDNVSTTLQGNLFGFVRIPSLFKEVLDQITGISDRIKNLDLSAIITGLKSVHDSLKAKVALIDLTDLKQSLDNLLKGLKQQLADLFPKQDIEDLVANFQTQVLDILEGLSPDTLIGQPLTDTWDGLLEKLDALDIEKLFESLLGVTDRIEDELDTGFDRTGKSFKALIDAVPV